MNTEKAIISIVLITLIVMGFNTFQMMQMDDIKVQNAGNGAGKEITANAMAMEQRQAMQSDIDVTPKGIPEIYGKELGVSYDDVSAKDQKKADETINKLGALDRQITLSGEHEKRYIEIASKISCEYCCGVEAIIFANGKPACGCEHSYAMRGLAKYLVKNHGSEYSDDEILEEMGKWKTLFFPMPMVKKAAVLQAKGIEINYVNLASNKYRNIESGGA